MEFKLIKAGYGTLAEVRKMTSREFIQALAYEKFTIDYQAAFTQLNSPKGV